MRHRIMKIHAHTAYSIHIPWYRQIRGTTWYMYRYGNATCIRAMRLCLDLFLGKVSSWHRPGASSTPTEGTISHTRTHLLPMGFILHIQSLHMHTQAHVHTTYLVAGQQVWAELGHWRRGRWRMQMEPATGPGRRKLAPKNVTEQQTVLKPFKCCNINCS